MFNLWFIVGLALLWFPVGLLLCKTAKLAGYERGSWPGGWPLVVVMLDPLRAAIGAWALLQGIEPLVELIGHGADGRAVLLGVATAVGVVIQTVSCKDEDFVYSPFAYTAGVLTFFLGPLTAIPAIILGIGSTVAMRVWTAFFMAAGLLSAILGAALAKGDWLTPLLVGLAVMLPPLVTVMLGRHMGFPRR